MKYCSKCGNELMDEAIICPKCGCQVAGFSIRSINNSSTNGFAIAGFVCSFFVGILGLIFGILGYSNSNKTGTGRGLSIAAIAISIISMVLYFVYLIIIIAVYA